MQRFAGSTVSVPLRRRRGGLACRCGSSFKSLIRQPAPFAEEGQLEAPSAERLRTKKCTHGQQSRVGSRRWSGDSSFRFAPPCLARCHAGGRKERHACPCRGVGRATIHGVLGRLELEVTGKMRFGPGPFELKRGNLGREAVDDALHLPRSRTRCLVSALCEVTIVLTFTTWWCWCRADVGDAGRGQRAKKVAGVEGRDCVLRHRGRHGVGLDTTSVLCIGLVELSDSWTGPGLRFYVDICGSMARQSVSGGDAGTGLNGMTRRNRGAMKCGVVSRSFFLTGPSVTKETLWNA